MSNHYAIATVTAALGSVIQSTVSRAIGGAAVSHRRPDDPQGNNAADARVNIYLYQVLPNIACRNADLPTRDRDGNLMQEPQVALNLNYLLSFYGDESVLAPQRLLGATVSRLHARSVLTREDIMALKAGLQADPTQPLHPLVASDLEQQIELVKLSLHPFNLEELSKLWSVFFQTPYTLSVAYQASVVLIQAQLTPQPTLPIQDYNVYVHTLQRPLIELVEAASGADQPITANSTLVVRGRNLRGDETLIRLGGVEVEPAQLNSRTAEVPLASLPAANLRAGVQGVQVIHRLRMGTPPTPHRGFESNVAAFVLRPTVTVDAANAKSVTVTVDPIVGHNQRVSLLLNRVEGGPDEAYVFTSTNRPADAAQISVDISNVATGRYLVRIQVDGAESQLTVDDDPKSATFNRYTEPFADIP